MSLHRINKGRRGSGEQIRFWSIKSIADFDYGNDDGTYDYRYFFRNYIWICDKRFCNLGAYHMHTKFARGLMLLMTMAVLIIMKSGCF